MIIVYLIWKRICKRIYNKLLEFLRRDKSFVQKLSRVATDTLALHRQYDQRIEIIDDNNLENGPSYSQTSEVLIPLKN